MQIRRLQGVELKQYYGDNTDFLSFHITVVHPSPLAGNFSRNRTTRIRPHDPEIVVENILDSRANNLG